LSLPVICPVELEIWADVTWWDLTSLRKSVYETDLALLVLIVPTASRMATMPIARTPHSQRQL